MGFLGGIVGSLFGGGGGTTQTATNKTAVTVNDTIQNQIDLTPVANAIKSTAAGTQSLLTKMQAQLAAQTAAAQAAAANAGHLISIIGMAIAAGVGIYIWRH